jgi:hypothetical protein
MAIINLHLDINENYKTYINDIYKLFTILIIIQILLNLLEINKDFFYNALSGSILNDDLVTLLFVIILGISSYYLIFNKILEIN